MGASTQQPSPCTCAKPPRALPPANRCFTFASLPLCVPDIYKSTLWAIQLWNQFPNLYTIRLYVCALVQYTETLVWQHRLHHFWTATLLLPHAATSKRFVSAALPSWDMSLQDYRILREDANLPLHRYSKQITCYLDQSQQHFDSHRFIKWKHLHFQGPDCDEDAWSTKNHSTPTIFSTTSSIAHACFQQSFRTTYLAQGLCGKLLQACADASRWCFSFAWMGKGKDIVITESNLDTLRCRLDMVWLRFILSMQNPRTHSCLRSQCLNKAAPKNKSTTNIQHKRETLLKD